MYPLEAEIDGKLYPINTDYTFALACFNVIDDEDISDTERALAIISILFGHIENGELVGIPENLNVALEKAAIFLSCDKENKNTDVKKDFDFKKDRTYINASFMSDYHIDLEDTQMHFWKFCELISGLTEDSILNRIRDLRNIDLSMYKDSKTREKIKEAQDRVALEDNEEMSEEEKQMLEEFEKLFG